MDQLPKRILHADDDPDICDVIRWAFDDYEGVNLRACHDGKALLDLAASFKPELILLDLKMPHFDGVDALRAMRANSDLQDIPVVLVTGYSDVKMKDAYRKLKVIGIIYKPFSHGTLPERIRHFWAVHKHGRDKDLGGFESPL